MKSIFRRFMAITKTLTDENRVPLLLALRGGRLSVRQLIELTGLAPRLWCSPSKRWISCANALAGMDAFTRMPGAARPF